MNVKSYKRGSKCGHYIYFQMIITFHILLYLKFNKFKFILIVNNFLSNEMG